MSWLDSGFSQIAGQISNFTKEVLTEGTEEVDDHATELRLARTRLGEIETHNTQQRFELERVKKENNDWADKLESAELQINALSAEYRAKLEESQNEVKVLKQKQHEMLENQSKMVLMGAPATLPHSSSLPSLNAESFTNDEHDFDDLISSQHEINRLRDSLQRLEAECRHWKQVATSQTNGATSLLEPQMTDSAAQEKIKSLEEELSNAIDSLQRERAALQDVHSQKVAALKQRHLEEVEALRQENLQLQHQGQQGISWSEALREEVARLKHELQAANAEKKQLTLKVEEIEMSVDSIGRMSPVPSPVSMTSSTPLTLRTHDDEPDLESPSASLILDLSEAAVQKQHLENTISMLQSQVETLEAEQQTFEEARTDWESEKEALESVVIELRRKLRQKEASSPAVTPTEDLSLDVGERSVEGAETPAETDSQSAQQSTVSSQVFDLQRQLSDMTTAYDGIKQEIIQLKEQLNNKGSALQSCEEKLRTAEQSMDDKNAEIRSSKQALSDSQQSLQACRQSLQAAEQKLLLAEQRISELTSHEEEHQSQLTEVSHTLKLSLVEKDATILQLREQFKASQSEGSNWQSVSKLKEELAKKEKQVVEMRKKLDAQEEEISQLKDELTIEKEALEASLEELNDQHEAAQKQILKKCTELQSANDELNEQISQLEQSTSGGESRLVDTFQEERTEVSNAVAQPPSMIPTTVPDIISEPFEMAGNQLEELRQRCELLEKENSKAEAELNTMYVQHGTLSNDLCRVQEECDTLKKQLTSKQSELDDMKVKAHKAAMTLNDLHMDKQELEVHICSLKGEVKTLQQQLKKASAESSEYKQNLYQVQSELERKQQELTQHLSSDSSDSLQIHLEQLETELSEKKKELENERRLRNDMKIDFDAIQEQLKDQQSVNTKLTTQLEENEKIISGKTSEIASLSAKITSIEEEFHILRQEKHEIEMKLNGELKQQGELSEILKARDASIASLQASSSSSQQIIEEKELIIQQLQMDLGQNKSTADELKLYKDENTKLKLDMDQLQSRIQELEAPTKPASKPGSFDLIHSLEAEVTNLNTKRENQSTRITQYEHQIQHLEMQLNEKDNEVQTLVAENDGQQIRLNESQVTLDQETQAVLTLQTSIVEKDKEIESLKTELGNLKLNFDTKLEKSDAILANGNMKQIENNQDENEDKDGPDNEKNDLMTEVEQLKKIVTQKEGVIAELRTGNSALMKLLEERSLAVHGDRTLVDYHKLDNEVRSMQREREQIMSILNEKSRECSNLKSEVHKLMNVVTQQKKALSKLQEDNSELMKPPQSPNQDMTKEAVRNLSRIIRDKDLEIESLSLKNSTLLQVLQGQSPSGEHLSTLIAERDNLSQQVAMYQKDRETIVAALQAKHEESVSFHTQLQQVTQLRALESQQLENVHGELISLRKQYEDKQQALVKANNDMVNYKQKHAELEMKCKELQFRQVGSEPSTPTDVSQDSEESQILIAALKETIVKKEEALHEAEKGWQCEKNALETQISNNQLQFKEFEKSIQEQHESMRELRSHMQNAQDVARAKELETGSWKKQHENLSFQLGGAQGEVSDLQQERDKLAAHREQLLAEVEQLRMANSRITASIGERDLLVSGLEERVATMTQLVAEREGMADRTEQRLVQSEAAHRQAQACQVERDQAWSALQMKQTECQQLTLQVEELTERERKLAREVERLRTHLLQIEEGYTQEAIAAEEREKELRNRLAIAEDSAAQTSSAVHSASLAASREVESLQEQVLAVTEQRDQVTAELASAQETANQYATSLANLQMVLEQFTHEKEQQQALEIERCRQLANEAIAERDDLTQRLASTQAQLDEATEALEAAHRLSEQLDKREEVIVALKDEVQLRENELQRVQDELDKVTSSSQAKVDKELVKNLFIGYFHTPISNRTEVVKLIGKVLQFSPAELQEIGAEENSGWLGGLFRRAATAPAPPASPNQTGMNKSLSELFITFLERESTPSPLVRLPAEQMVREQQQQQQERRNHAQFNPFSVPAHVTPPIGRQSASSGGSQHHLLMNPAGGQLNPMTAATLPLFTPVTPTDSPTVGRPESANRLTNVTPVLVGAGGSGRVSASSSGRSTPASSSAILQGVLQQ